MLKTIRTRHLMVIDARGVPTILVVSTPDECDSPDRSQTIRNAFGSRVIQKSETTFESIDGEIYTLVDR